MGNESEVRLLFNIEGNENMRDVVIARAFSTISLKKVLKDKETQNVSEPSTFLIKGLYFKVKS